MYTNSAVLGMYFVWIYARVLTTYYRTTVQLFECMDSSNIGELCTPVYGKDVYLFA